MCPKCATDAAKLDNLCSPPPQPHSPALITATLMKRSPIKYLTDIFKTASAAALNRRITGWTNLTQHWKLRFKLMYLEISDLTKM